jgi:dolichyl-phosphate-mannose-protein mannosyltransferase
VAAIVRYPVALLCLLGALTRFPGLAYPREVVFDEVTFGKDVAAYCCTGQRIFDVHPPHAKLLIAAAAKLGGFTGTFTFDRIGLPYGDQPVVALRFVPALAGALIPVVFYLFLIQLNASRPLALLGGILVALDNALIAETRIIVFDGILVAATFGALACFFAAERRAGIGWQLVTAGLLAGLAVGTKTTGLAALGVMGMSLLVGAGPVSRSPASRLKQGIVIAAGAFGVYAAGWLLHGLLLTSPGPADAFYPTSGHMLEDLLTAHRTMLERNFAVVGGHPDASRAWTWPWMKVVPFLW